MMKEEGEGEEAGVVRATLQGRAGDEAALERFKEATAQKKKKWGPKTRGRAKRTILLQLHKRWNKVNCCPL